MKETKETINWSTFLQPYEFAVNNFLIKLDFIKSQYQKREIRNPIESVTGRIKNPTSIMEKLERLNIPFSRVRDLNDIGGIRITCKYIQEVYEIYELLKARKDIEIRVVKDYIKFPKPSGYRSLHIVANYEAETISGRLNILIEFQIRTLAMHLWSSIEHSLKYKYFHNIPEDIQSRLIESGKITTELDLEMSKIREDMDKFKSKERKEEEDDFWKVYSKRI